MKNVPFFRKSQVKLVHFYNFVPWAEEQRTELYCSILYPLYVMRSTLLCIYTFESQSKIINFPYFSCYTHLDAFIEYAACKVDSIKFRLHALPFCILFSLHRGGFGELGSEELLVFKQYCKFVHRSCSLFTKKNISRIHTSWTYIYLRLYGVHDICLQHQWLNRIYDFHNVAHNVSRQYTRPSPVKE